MSYLLGNLVQINKFDLGFSNLCVHASYGESEVTEALEVDYYNVGALASKSHFR